MRRLDRLLDQARLLRAKRAARAQGLIDDGGAVVDWLAESAAAQAILEGLAEDPDAPLDPRRQKGHLDVMRREVLAEFVARCEAAVCQVVAEVDPVGRLASDMMPRVCAASSPHFVALHEKAAGGGPEAGKARASLGPLDGAVRDAATLAVENALFEVLRRFNLSNDLGRRVSLRRHTASVRIEDGTVKRPPRDLAAKRARKAEIEGRRKAREAGTAFVSPVSGEAAAMGRLAAARPAGPDRDA